MMMRDEQGELIKCPDCKRLLMLKDDKPFCFYCEVIAIEDKQLAAATVLKHERAKFDRQIESFQQNSLINEKLKKANFDNYLPQNESQEKALRWCKRYAANFNPDKPASLLLHGPFGTGKSHLAKSVTDVVMAKDITCLFISVPKLMTKLKGTFKDKTVSEYDVLEMIASVQLLVLDDLGAERNSAAEDTITWAKSKLFEIFDSRAGKHTIITTNFDIGQVIKVYGEREISRFLEDSTRIPVTGGNYRMRNF
jgi:DNA replication protein DnaC